MKNQIQESNSCNFKYVSDIRSRAFLMKVFFLFEEVARSLPHPPRLRIPLLQTIIYICLSMTMSSTLNLMWNRIMPWGVETIFIPGGWWRDGSGKALPKIKTFSAKMWNTYFCSDFTKQPIKTYIFCNIKIYLLLFQISSMVLSTPNICKKFPASSNVSEKKKVSK